MSKGKNQRKLVATVLLAVLMGGDEYPLYK